MPSPVRNVLLLLAAGTIVGLYFASQATLNPVMRDLIPFDTAVAVNLVYYYLWALAAPMVFLVARGVPIERDRWWRSLTAHAAGSVGLTLLIIVAAEAILTALGFRSTERNWVERISFATAANFHGLLPTYWMLLLGYLAFDFYVKLRDREVRAAQLEARLSEARLAALKAQLQPHFLFNTMNSISSLMYENVDAADAMLTRLSDLLRLTIERDRQVVTLREELELVRRYLDIERVRFEDRLRVDYRVESGLDETMVPSLVLQPLVENAIHHSIAQRETGGCIRISAARRSGTVELQIEDDGPGLPEDRAFQKGIGLANTEARLAQLYGDAAGLEFTNRVGAFAVRILIPLEGTAS